MASRKTIEDATSDRREVMLKKLGVGRIINAVGTTTLTGGSILSKRVLEAMNEASQVYVDMPSLHEKAGKYIADLLGVDAAYVTSGAAAALILGVTSCMTEGILEKMRRVPDARGMRNEVIVQGLHRNMYDRNLELAGAKIVEVGDDNGTSEQEFRKAFGEHTAAVLYFMFDPQPGVLPLEKVIEIAHAKKVPVITDAAAELPPVSNLTKFLSMGSDLVIFSGGKDIQGPNNTGLLMGRRSLVDIARRLGPHSYEVVDPKLTPYRRTIVFTGRPMKTSKEDILGLLAALTEYVQVDEEERIAKYTSRVDKMVEALSQVKRAKARKIWPPYGHPRPLTIPRVEIELISIDAAHDLATRLREESPPIHVWEIGERVFINPQAVAEEDDQVIVSRLLRLLS